MNDAQNPHPGDSRGPMTVAQFKRELAAVAQKMTVGQINEVLSRHHGAKRKLARELGVSPTQITNTLKNEATSARIVAAARAMVVELLEVEKSWAGGAAAKSSSATE